MEGTQVQDIVYALAASPDFSHDGICFAARGSGLYRTDDGGHTWCAAYDALNLEAPLTTTAVALSPDFAADHSVFAGVPGGVLRSFDGGQSWHIATFPEPPPLVSSLVISPNYRRDGTLLAGTLEDGVFRSADRGQRWAAWNFGLLDLNILCLAISPDFSRDETLFAGTETGIFRSTNGGRAWREVGLATECAPVLSLLLSPGYAGDGIVFAGTESHGLFQSADRGKNWGRTGFDIITSAVNAVVLSPDYPTRPELLVALSDGLLVSRDGGESWTKQTASWGSAHGVASVAGPQGLEPRSPLLVGLVGGGVAIHYCE